MKQIDGYSIPDVFDAYKMMFWNLHDVTSILKAYNMVQWSKYIDHWSRTHGQRFTTPYQRGEILMVDLGAMNYGFELAYSHPVVVLYSTLDMLFVIPGSSKRFGCGKKDTIDATSANDGFNKNTGLLLNHMRWIHKNRVKQTTGTLTSSRILEKIEKYNLTLNEEYHKEVADRARVTRQLRADKFNLAQQVEQQKQEILNKQSEISESQLELENYKKGMVEGLEKLKEQTSDETALELINLLLLQKN
ncbi:hypothetical protein [Saccharibacillus sacchari]|uniref:Uncharacterized protein n=1 Tax=Saccharibacillus sacchari TaxID=456493 RepID=A0ACC6PG48_9BACL